MMYQVSRIEPVSATRYLVHLEGEDPFPLYKKEAERYGIREGGCLAEEAYQEITRVLLPKRVCERAMNLLLKMDRTQAQLRKKLEESLYPAYLVDYALDYVKGFHYIDDVRYACSYIDYRKDSHSRLQLISELRAKGISREDIEEAFSKTDMPDEREQILYWKRKRDYRPGEADQKEKQRFYQFLLRKGFSMSSIRSALER